MIHETGLRPLASVSLDLDNQWSYMKTHGDAAWDSYPSYLDVFLPYMLDLLDSHDLRITFFIVGKDAANERNRDALSLITQRSHSVGNHSYHHEPWLHLYSREEIEWEIAATEDAIEQATGARPHGFRGPGFSWSPTLLEVLVERGYTFDAATLPTWIGPLARMYYFRTADLSREERRKRSALFGRLTDGFLRLRPHYKSVGARERLLEIPVTTVPLLRTPFHLSYLLYLYRANPEIMRAYLKTALFLCRLTAARPSFLLHPLDVLGDDQVPELRFFPGMDLSAGQKREAFDWVIGYLKEHYRLTDMYAHADEILRRASNPAA